MEDNDEENKPHAIMVALPLQGHINPFVHLAIKLAIEGFTITFINTQAIHHQITKAAAATATATSNCGDDDQELYDIFTETKASSSGLDIRYKTVNDGFPLEFDRTVNRDQFVEGLLHVFPAHIDVLVGKLVASSTDNQPPITCLIADTFYPWPSMIASKYNLVNVSFWTEAALVFSLYYHLDLLKINGHFASLDNRKDSIKYIPGVEAIEPKDLTSFLQDANTTTPLHRLIYKSIFGDVKRADFIICNTIQELEPKPILALNQNQPFYPIGPTFLLNGFTKTLSPTSLWSESDCTHWLQTKPHGSVLYISFGSLAQCSKQDIVEIGYGLLLSNVSFVWVLRPNILSSGDTDLLPVGFQVQIRDKGLIVPWCCQISVISHPTVGGFLTHCGWNSVLESIWCGVPMLCYPIFTDQFTNRKLVVDDWKIGLNFCDNNKLITRDEVAEKISCLMNGKSAIDLRRNIKEIKEIVDDAVSTVGSSEKNFNKFVSDVKVKISKVAN